MQLFIVDAFADEIFGGNPAGVVILPNGCDFPKDEIMVKTAAELRYSETAFIKRLGEKEFTIRYFTPVAEVDLCGHATIASFAALLHTRVITDGKYMNHTLAGDLNIDIKDGFIYMDMAEPTLFKSINSAKELSILYEVMGLDYDAEKSGGLTLSPQIISTGLPDIMLPVKDFESLQRISPDFPKLAALSEKDGVTGVHAFAQNPDSEGTYHVRNFGPRVGIDEESATGTSNGALTCYLFINGLAVSGAMCKFVQGEKMDRPSVIITRLTSGVSVESLGESSTSKEWLNPQSPIKIPCSIQVGGSGVIVASGEINL